ncbi:MAG TPA: hypothetical protein PLD25_32005 [Chloroflexota bacterium]|nr:hypothetical protein [Chloroflexota bacterium]
MTDLVELHEPIRFAVCGWPANVPAEMKLMMPNGKIIEETLIAATPQAGLQYEYKTNVLQDVPGIYRIVLEGTDHVLIEESEVRYPSSSRLYWEDDGRLILFNFQPNEKVTIYAYKSGVRDANSGKTQYILQATQEFETDAEGLLIIEPQVQVQWYAAIGSLSGEVFPSFPSSPRLFGQSGEVSLLNQHHFPSFGP